MRVATIYPTPWRFVAVGLHLWAGAGGLVCLVGVLLSPDGVPPMRLVRAVALLAAAPAAAAWSVRRAFRGTIAVTTDRVVLVAPGRSIDVPLEAVGRVEPGWLPFPDASLVIRLRSGRPLGVRIGLDDPLPVFQAIAPTRRQPRLRLRYAHLWGTRSRLACDRVAWKVVGLGLLVTLPLFRVDQIISYGGTLGQYYQQGAMPYLLHFGLYWATVATFLGMFAALIRVPLESLAWLVTAAAPARAAQARQRVEWLCRTLYYGTIPVVLVLRFWPW